MITKIREALGRVSTHELVRRTSLLSIGVASGQMLTLAASPVLTRLFDPHAFGLFGLFTSVAFVVGNVSSLRYDLGIVLAKSRPMAAALWSLSVLATILTAALVALFLAVGGNALLASMTGAAMLMDVLPWAPFQILSIGIFLASSQWATRVHHFKSQAEYQFTRAAVVAALQILAGALVLGVHGLVAAQIVGFFLALTILLRRSVAKDWSTLRRGFSRRRLSAAATRYRGLPLFAAPQDLMTAITQNLPYVILGRNYDPIVVGHFWLTVRTLQLPINFFGQALRNVLLRHVATRVLERRKLVGDFVRTTGALAVVGTIVFTPVIVFGPELFSLVFGEKWSASGSYSRWVAVWMLTSIAKIPSWCVLHAFHRQRFQLIFEGLLLVLQFAVLIVVSAQGEPLQVIRAYVLTYVVLNMSMMLASLGIVRAADRRTTG